MAVTTDDRIGQTFDIGRVIGRVFTTFKRNAVTFGVAGFMVWLLTAAIELGASLAAATAVSPQHRNEWLSHGFFGGLGILCILGFLLPLAFVHAMVVWGSISDLTGKKPGVGQCLRAGWRHMLPVAGVGALYMLGVWAGAWFLVIPGLALATVWAAATPCQVWEDTGVMESLSNSIALTENNRLAIFGLRLVMGVIGFGVVAATLLIVSLLVGATMPAIYEAAADANPLAVGLGVLDLLLYMAAIVVLLAGGSVVPAAIYVELKALKGELPGATLEGFN
ncbi:hypothetical protein QO010_002604 [Caulobacter ginsengisoli]|uniref:Glycerophosphoryl diester phosphodiesterase membrane domain-containing protein n=1 Tax=Caulobacter ginsengisoli TaxID=400775 RepID=A0ABU0ITR9_9CAUL|nr:hypothetical protein [Caulobacter ginsengisoli]MDQ0464820.1 hypothetical protein [Caulobacter ginsengisoli]